MKIIFICGSIEPGNDGVGDYTRRLSGELIRFGHEVQIISLSDKQVKSFVVENQEIEKTIVNVRRIPIFTNNKQRLALTQKVLNEIQPDWISLQFVPFSFHPKGIPFWISDFLMKLKGNHQWHIMFHELWIGMDSDASVKSRFIGFLQKQLILKILKVKEKIIINTQTDLYKSKIAELGYKADILPLFSNIIKNIPSNIEPKKKELELRFCIFGSIHYGAPVEKFIHELKQVLLSSNDKKELKFVFIGNCGVAVEKWKKVLLANNINFEITGFVSDQEICVLLSSCQYGVSTTPYILCQKSGSVAAMFDHQLPVICVARNWIVDGFNKGKFLNSIHYESKDSIIDFIKRKFIVSNENNLDFVAVKFLKGLK